ncbi:two-component regulator propeller domain-containing protein [Pedobacter alpinus]|uniref:Two-component regulator propeller domain-containing protein n=1 Tax=Pedobacter alpinus TaxID=1590643 RepID=A0ABW5TM77_9SPHI
MNRLLLFLLLFFYNWANAQEVALGRWRTHLPFNNVVSIAVSEEKIFCATTGGLFTVDAQNGEINKFSTINGLADINTKKIAWDTQTKQLLIAYKNSKIDLLAGEKIYALPEIFEKSGLGDKSINAITFSSANAYLSCGFGIVIYDLLKREVKDTYFLGVGGTNLAVFETAIIGNQILAATANGIYETNLQNPLIADANTWKKHGIQQNYPSSNPASLVPFNGYFYALFDDAIFRYKDNTWVPTQIFRPNVNSLSVSNNQLLSISTFRVISYNQQEAIIKNIQNSSKFNALNAAIIDANNNIYLADAEKGVLLTKEGTTFNYLLPNGPNTLNVSQLNYINNKIYLAPGAITQAFAPAFFNDGFSVFSQNEWQGYSEKNSNIFNGIKDIVATTYSSSENTIYLASYVNGLLAFDANGILKAFDQNNSSLQLTIGDPTNIRVNGVAFDSKKNLCVTQYGVNKPLSVKKNDGSWTAYDFPADLPNPVTSITGLLIDGSDNKWLMLRSEGLLIFDGSKTRKIGFSSNNGALPGSNVNALTLDKDGAIWIGTNQGVAAVFNASDLFSGANVEIPNLIENGFLKPLLADQNIKCIAVDGANRKWIGSDNGVWLFNSAGTQQIQYFNTGNSPLLNNSVISITIDDVNGEVFFGTASGIISYKGDATEPVQKMDKVIVYPNPVRPGFNGNIGIKGLSQNAYVKITDISGTLVYETRANGGQATWNGKNFNQQEAASGVYLVLVVNNDGTDTAVGKILIVR